MPPILSAPRVTRPLTVPAPKKQRQSEEYLIDVVLNIEGALYLGVAMPSSRNFLGCEFFSDRRQANVDMQNATIAPGRVSFNGTSMPLGRLSTMSDCPPYASNPNCSPPCPSLPLSLPFPGSPGWQRRERERKVDGLNACGGITQGNLQAPSTTQASCRQRRRFATSSSSPMPPMKPMMTSK